jgi:hypothetical protein
MFVPFSLIAQLQLHSSDAIFYSGHKKILEKNRKTATTMDFNEFQGKNMNSLGKDRHFYFSCVF